MSTARLKILYVAAEAYPFAKVGGLADVASALPKALGRKGHDVRLLLPGYPSVGKGKAAGSFEIPMGQATELVRIRSHGSHDRVQVYSADNRTQFGRERIYGYDDDDARFILFSKAAVAFAADADWTPDIVHVNDWHLGFVPQYLRLGPHRDALERTATVLTIHNLTYQGPFDPGREAIIGLGDRFWGNPLARGIAFADAVNTVSRRYLEEILTSEHGMGLETLLQACRDRLHGILNGVDYEEFDPSADPHIVAPYDVSSLSAKRSNKLALQRRTGLVADEEVPLLGMVARLVDQKGVDLLCAGLDKIVQFGVQVVVVGNGEIRYEEELRSAAARHAGAVAYCATDKEDLARLVYAGSDLILAPSRYEPCGLGPLIALRYGAIPIVRRTGGLAETISDYSRSPRAGLGFTFVAKYPKHLVKTVQSALEVYRDKPRWEELQRRAMRANFSWGRSVQKYEQMYRKACERRRTRDAKGNPRPVRRPSVRSPLSVALVHHANQHLITDGYEDRDGVTKVLDGYEAVLRLHERYGVPASLHLSGTLLEAIAWNRPEFLELVKDLVARGLLSLVGGTYSENVMTLFPPAFNRRQLHELLTLYQRLLGCPAEHVKISWVPERVWDTARLAPVLTSPGLRNGGYRYVLLDDRILFPVGPSYPGSPRASFDSGFPTAPGYTDRPALTSDDPIVAETCRPYLIAGGRGLAVVPISANLRYWIPPRVPDHWQLLDRAVTALVRERDPRLLVFADDLERTAGVGGWGHTPDAYDLFLQWLVDQEGRVRPVHLEDWLERNPPREERSIDAGTFYELAQGWQAGEDYRGWSEDAAWTPYQSHLTSADEALRAARRERGDKRVLALGWKHLLASAYETAWHDPTDDGRGHVPAPWAKALASHTRSCLAIAAAAEWFSRSHGRPEVEVVDIDGDGDEEIVLRNEDVFAVLTRRYGARLIYLFHRLAGGGVLSIGNPTDHWNLQEELNQYMVRPANHPGALSDVGFENDPYRVDAMESGTDYAFVELTNTAVSAALGGARKSFLLPADSSALAVRYELPAGAMPLAVESCLSPDYYRLLRDGRRRIRRREGPLWRGCSNGAAMIWLARAADEDSIWTQPRSDEAGHGLNVGVEALGRRFHLLVGSGGTDDERCQKLIEWARGTMDALAVEARARPVTGDAEVVT